MRRMLGVALAAGLAVLPVSAYALDSAQGVVQSADIFTGVLVITTAGDNASDMSFNVSEKVDFYELFLEPGDRVTVGFDGAECAGKDGCILTAQQITPTK